MVGDCMIMNKCVPEVCTRAHACDHDGDCVIGNKCVFAIMIGEHLR